MRYLFFLIPAVMDAVTGVVFFISAKRMADGGANSLMVSLTMTAWGVFYALMSFWVGRFQTKRNATKILFTSLALLLVSLMGLMFTEQLYLQYIWLVGTGIGCGLFFAPFQVVVKLFGKEEYALESIAQSTALYTFSWSIGLASGPFLAAFIWGIFAAKNGWQYCYLITILLVLAVLAEVVVMHFFVKRRLREEAHAASKEFSPSVPEEQKKLPDLMMAGWILATLGYIAVSMMRTYLPDFCTKILSMSTFRQGIVVGTISVAQAFTGLLCAKARRWPYRPTVVAAVSFLAGAAFLLFASTTTWAAYLAAALFLGIFSGVFCFLLTFHALIHPSKTPRYVAVNETIVGATSIFAPPLGGVMAAASPHLPFYFCAILALLSLASYAYFTKKVEIPKC